LVIFRNIQEEEQKMEDNEVQRAAERVGLERDIRLVKETIDNLEARRREKRKKLDMLQVMLE
jgi:hypothetical protein